MSDTLARLAKLRAAQQPALPSTSRMIDLGAFGSNPGTLEAWVHAPAELPQSPGLVVALHGCTQTAAAYERGSGWSRLADEYGFVVLYPQQTRQNNPNTCFNWFAPDDIRRDEGEALSIRQMIDAAIRQYHIDPARIFVTGLSAGGAMANVMLATYPEVFAAGSIIAGLPYGCATRVPQAFDLMRGHGIPDEAELQDRLLQASRHRGPWPVVSVWHGTRDSTVAPANGHAIIKQWQAAHGVVVERKLSDVGQGMTRTVWESADGTVLLQHMEIDGMGHGTPIDGDDGYGIAAPYILDVGISSTLHSARSWGLIASFEKRSSKRGATFAEQPPASTAIGSLRKNENTIQTIIEDALRSAGLLNRK